MPAYYNEIDPQMAAWLRELISEGLIAPGDVDERSIKDVTANDVQGYCQCHFFAGVGGWSYALRLAGWPDERPVWTGSAPCQPFSCAGKGLGAADDRNLWPPFMRLIRERKPECIFGEQVEAAIRSNWFDRVSADLETEAYTVGAAVLGAHSAGADHIRQRLYWMAHANALGRLDNSTSTRLAPERQRTELREQRGGECVSGEGCADGRLGHTAGDGREQRRAESGRPIGVAEASGMGDANQQGLPQRGSNGQVQREALESSEGQALECRGNSFWSDAIWHQCRDGKARRIPEIESGFLGMVDGLPEGLDLGWLESSFPLCETVKGRVGLLKGYGNSITPQVAALFIEACSEIIR